MVALCVHAFPLRCSSVRPTELARVASADDDLLHESPFKARSQYRSSGDVQFVTTISLVTPVTPLAFHAALVAASRSPHVDKLPRRVT